METTTWIVLIVLLCITCLIGVLLSFYFLQEKLIFNPIKLPADYKFPFEIPFEERFFEVDTNVNINALLFKSHNPKGLIFYIHGNADNLRYWGEFASNFTQYNYDVLMYDYRGFGKSQGSIKGERNLQRDAKRIYLKMIKEYGEENTIIYGFSIGTGIASRLGSNNSPKHLILEAPYFNFIDLIKYHKAYLPADLISKYHFRTNKYLTKAEVPITIFHGTEDRKVPFYSGEKLKQVNDTINFIAVEGATHSDMLDREEYHQVLARILS